MKSLMTGVCLSLLMAAAPARAADVPERCSSPDGEKCTVDLASGIKMAYLESGPTDGKVVILLHGLTDSSRSWSTAMMDLRELDPELHVYALDQRGHGATSMPAGANCPQSPKSCFTPLAFSADVIAFMNAMGIEKATLAGHSMGSIVAQEVALARPERVERIVLVATSAATKDNPVVRDYVLKEPVLGTWKKGLEAKGVTTPEAIWNATPKDADPKAEEWIAANWDVDMFADPAFLAPIVPETANVKMGTWIGATEALLETDNTARLAKLSVPTLVLWGTQDAIFYKAPDQDGMIAALKSSKAPWIWKQYGTMALPASGFQESDIGHNIQWEAPAAVAADIVSFIQTGKPTDDLTRAEMKDGKPTFITEEGKAITQTGP